MPLGTLVASLLGNILAFKAKKKTSQGPGIHRAEKGQWINRASKGIVIGGYGSCSSKIDF